MSEQEFIPADVYKREMDAYQDTLPVGGIARELNRRQVTTAILETFHLVGGINAFALWARDNPEAFYPMWAKMAPRTEDGVDGNQLKIVHVLPPSPLDE